MDDIYKNIEEYHPIKKCKILIVFDDMIADVLNNKKLNPVATELFIRGRKLNIFLVVITQSYFAVPTHYFVIKIPNNRELQHIAFNHSLDTDFPDFINLYKKCLAKPYSLLVIDTTLVSDNLPRFRKNLI